MLQRYPLVFALLLPMACDIGAETPQERCHASGGSWEARGCSSTEQCYFDGYRGSYSPVGNYAPYDAGRYCVSTADCDGRKCTQGVCQAAPVDPTRCVNDNECTPGASCVDGRCGCTTDSACGTGFRCEAARSGASVVGSCVVCSGAGACTEPTCAPDGTCPGELVCNEQTVTCGIPTQRIACTNDVHCPNGMTCGTNHYCRRGTARDGGLDGASKDASNDVGDSSDP